MHKLEIIAQGAEAKIYSSGDKILKHRFSKKYRNEELDLALIKQRTKSEKKILSKLSEANIPVPKLFPIPADFLSAEPKNINNNLFSPINTICMERINGIPLKNADLNYELVYELGALIRKIHDLNIVHGDLTTGNFIVNDFIYVIDFGLAFFSSKDEDKAVDLYVLERAFECLHGKLSGFFEGYGESNVIKKLEEVRKRGRKREMLSFG